MPPIKDGFLEELTATFARVLAEAVADIEPALRHERLQQAVSGLMHLLETGSGRGDSVDDVGDRATLAACLQAAAKQLEEAAR